MNVSRFVRQIAAYMRRDFYHDLSYRFAFAMGLAGFFFFVAVWFFVSRFLDKRVPIGEGGQTVDYFTYVLLGIAAMNYLQTALNGFTARLYAEQATGTLEAMLVTPVPIETLVAGTLFWDFAFGSLQIVLYVALAAVFFGLPVHGASVAGFAAALALTAALAAAFGMLSASFILVMKRGDPLNLFLTAFHAFLGSVFFPADVLPPWLAGLAKFVPLTYALKAMRESLLLGKSFSEVTPDLLILAAFTTGLLFLGMAAFRKAVDMARRHGSLGQY